MLKDTERTFVLGLGAQKSATTSLSDYIRSDKRYVSSIIKQKELHIWDAVDSLVHSQGRRSLLNFRDRSQLLLAVMERFPEVYFRHFSRSLADGGIFADITPSYCGLCADRLKFIKNKFDERGVLVKAVFVMRDPVSRCVSAFNMHKNSPPGKKSKNWARHDVDDDSAFLEYIESEYCKVRTEYHVTIQNMEESFSDDQTGIFLFETLFCSDNLKILNNFLEIEGDCERLRVKSNVGKGGANISESSLKECAKIYGDVYKNIGNMIPAAKIHWRGFKYIG